MKMAATTLNSSSRCRVTGKAQLGGVSRSPASYTQLTFSIRQPIRKATATFHSSQSDLLLAPRKHTKICSAANSDQAEAAEATKEASSNNAESSAPESQAANGAPPQAKEPPKRPPLTAREKLRAARVLGKYAGPKAAAPASKKPKAEFGSNVLDALREGDKGGRRRRSGLPEAPTNLFDDSKRGMPKEGWTFELPVGTDVLAVLASFVLISTVMLGTTYLVWKVGAIHYNEY